MLAGLVAPQLTLPRICVGTSALGGNPAVYGYDVARDTALAALGRVLARPDAFVDTSNEYGRSEALIGEAISRAGAPPPGFVISTKADPLPGGDFGGRRVLDSFDDSARLLGLSRIDVYHLHDPERFAFDDLVAPGGAVSQLQELRETGRAAAIGVASGSIEMIRRFLDLDVFDIVLHHNGYNLLDQSADPLIDEVRTAGLAFINAAPYGSGILAKPASAQPRFRYREPDAGATVRTRRLRELCAAYEVDLPALALQFSTNDSRIASTVAGVSRPERVDQLFASADADIPRGLWEEVGDVLGFLPVAARAAR